MPVWLAPLLPYLIKFVLPVILTELARSGMAGECEALAVKAGLKVYTLATGAKTFYAPPDFPKYRTAAYAKGQSNGNFNK